VKQRVDDYLEILDFVETEGLIDHVDPVQYTIRLLVPPRSALLDRPAIRPFLGPLDRPPSAIAGPTPIPVWIASTSPSARWSRRRRGRRRIQRSRSSGSASWPRPWRARRAVKATGWNR